MRVELIEAEDVRWKQLLKDAVHNAYLLPGYAKACARTDPGQVMGLYVEADGGACLLPLIVRNLPPLPDEALAGWRDATSPYGYPGALRTGPLRFEGLREEVTRVLSQHRILTAFVRSNPFDPDANQVLEQLGPAVAAGDTVFMDLLRDELDLWKATRAEHRREILRFESDGYRTRVDDWSHMPAFKALYAATMQRVAARGFYRFDDAYFDRLQAELGDWLHLVSVLNPAREVVSAGLYFSGTDGRVHAHLTGTHASKLGATKVLHDAAWRWAKARGSSAFHLGGGLGRANDRLLLFKTGFSNTVLPFFTVRMICEPEIYRRASAAASKTAPSPDYFPAYRAPEEPEQRPPGRSEHEPERVVEDAAADRQ